MPLLRHCRLPGWGWVHEGRQVGQGARGRLRSPHSYEICISTPDPAFRGQHPRLGFRVWPTSLRLANPLADDSHTTQQRPAHLDLLLRPALPHADTQPSPTPPSTPQAPTHVQQPIHLGHLARGGCHLVRRKLLPDQRQCLLHQHSVHSMNGQAGRAHPDQRQHLLQGWGQRGVHSSKVRRRKVLPGQRQRVLQPCRALTTSSSL